MGGVSRARHVAPGGGGSGQLSAPIYQRDETLKGIDVALKVRGGSSAWALVGVERDPDAQLHASVTLQGADGQSLKVFLPAVLEASPADGNGWRLTVSPTDHGASISAVNGPPDQNGIRLLAGVTTVPTVNDVAAAFKAWRQGGAAVWTDDDLEITGDGTAEFDYTSPAVSSQNAFTGGGDDADPIRAVTDETEKHVEIRFHADDEVGDIVDGINESRDVEAVLIHDTMRAASPEPVSFKRPFGYGKVSGTGISAAVTLQQDGDAAKGIEIALKVPGAGADWALLGSARRLAVQAQFAFQVGANGFNFRMPAAVAVGAAGNAWQLTMSASSNIALSYNVDSQVINIAHNGNTYQEIVDALNAQWAGSATVIGSGAANAPTGTPSRVSNGGVDAQPISGTANEGTKQYTVVYHEDHDDVQAIVDAINESDDAEATLIYGTMADATPEDAATLDRAFEGRRGATGEDGDDGADLEKALNADVDAEADDTKYMTVAKTFRAIARKVKNATEAVRGLVLLARNEDVDATETEASTRVPVVSKVKRLIDRVRPADRMLPDLAGGEENQVAALRIVGGVRSAFWRTVTDGTDGRDGNDGAPVEMPFLAAGLPAAGANLRNGSALPNNWGSVALEKDAAESSDDVDDAFTVGGPGVTCRQSGRVMIEGTINLSGASGSNRYQPEIRLRRTRDSANTDRTIQAVYVMRGGVAADAALNFITIISVNAGDVLQLLMRRRTQSLTIGTAHIGFMRMVGARDASVAGAGPGSGAGTGYHAIASKATTSFGRVTADAQLTVLDAWYVVGTAGLTGTMVGNPNKLVRKTAEGVTHVDPVVRLPYPLIHESADPDDDEAFLGFIMWTGTAWKRVVPGDNNTAGYLNIVSGGGNSVFGNASGALGADNSVTAAQAFAIGNQNRVTGSDDACAIGSANIASGRASLAVNEDNEARGARSLAAGLENAVNKDARAIFGQRGVVGAVTTLFGWAFGNAEPSDAQKAADADRNLVAKVKTDGTIVATHFRKSATPSTSDGDEIPATDAEIKTAYERNADTNAFTDADHTKLDSLGDAFPDVHVLPVGIEALSHAALQREFIVQVGRLGENTTLDHLEIRLGGTRVYEGAYAGRQSRLVRFTPSADQAQEIINRNPSDLYCWLNFRTGGLAGGSVIYSIPHRLGVGPDYAPQLELHVESPAATNLWAYQNADVVAPPAFATAIYSVVPGGHQLSNWEAHWQRRPNVTGTPAGKAPWIARVDRDPGTGLPVAVINRVTDGYSVRYYRHNDLNSTNSATYDANVHAWFRERDPGTGMWGPLRPIHALSRDEAIVFSMTRDFTDGGVTSPLGWVAQDNRYAEWCIECHNHADNGVAIVNRYRSPWLPIAMIMGTAAHDAATGIINNQFRVRLGGDSGAGSLGMADSLTVSADWADYDGIDIAGVFRRASGDANTNSLTVDTVRFAPRAGGANKAGKIVTLKMLAR